MTILKGWTLHCASSETTACGSTSGTSSSAGASMGVAPRRAINSPKCAPVRVSRIATTLDFIRDIQPRGRSDCSANRNARPESKILPMLNCPKWLPALWPPLLCLLVAGTSPASADPDGTRQAFVAALQRVRLNLPETPDSPALEAYALHDYLVAARLRRDLQGQPGDALDT